MPHDTWETRELLLLQAIADADDVPVDAHQLAEVVDGIEHESLMRVLRNLFEADYIDAVLVIPDQADYPVRAANIRLKEKGRIAVGTWPSQTAAADRFIQVIELLLQEERDPARRTKLQTLRDAARSVGTSVLSTVLGQVASEVLRHV